MWERSGFHFGQPLKLWNFINYYIMSIDLVVNRTVYSKFTIAAPETHQWHQWRFSWADFAHCFIAFEHVSCIERCSYLILNIR